MPQSTDQMVLVGSALFLNRIQYLSVTQARVVLAETGVGATHATRAHYARQIVSNPASYAPVVAVMVVGGVNLLPPATITGSGDTADSSATDAAILSQIATFWNSLAGVDSGS